jgi:hypothetical protein
MAGLLAAAVVVLAVAIGALQQVRNWFKHCVIILE